MKSISCFILLCSLNVNSFAQLVPTSPLKVPDYDLLMQKSKKQKKAALMLYGGGAALAMTGIALIGSHGLSPNPPAEALTLIGAASAISGFTLLALSLRNKKKAKLSLHNKPTGRVTSQTPSLHLLFY